MGITLLDEGEDGPHFSINFWHWRAIVEAVRRLDVLPPEKVDGLHEPFCANGLSAAEAQQVADAIEKRLLPSLEEGERLLLRGEHTTAPDEGTFHKTDVEQNYSTNRAALLLFVDFCRNTSGFTVA